jgi:uncharacterized protein YjiS (DUF1127 family)
MTYLPLERLRQEGFRTAQILTWPRAAWRAWRNRRAAWRLARLDDRLLADIGLTRGDVERALSLPFWEDPTRQLHRISWERRWARRR